MGLSPGMGYDWTDKSKLKKREAHPSTSITLSPVSTEEPTHMHTSIHMNARAQTYVNTRARRHAGMHTYSRHMHTHIDTCMLSDCFSSPGEDKKNL